MRITVCELPHEPDALADAWLGLCQHTALHQPDLVLLPEFAFVEPVWTSEHVDAARWDVAVRLAEDWMHRLPELGAAHVVGARPVSDAGQRFNEGFAWLLRDGALPLRRKAYLPDETGGREARWFTRGERSFPVFQVEGLTYGLNICTELWALETYAGYASQNVHAILSPRATAAATTAKWLAVGTVAAVRSGAYSLSSNRVHVDGSCGGAGWIIAPDGELLAQTSAAAPFSTVEIDLTLAAAAQRSYPRYVFDGEA